MIKGLHYSRPIRAAESLGDLATSKHQFTDKTVLLEANAEILRTRNGQLCLLYSLYLLPRFCAHITVFIPVVQKEFSDSCRTEADRIVFSGEITFVDAISNRDSYTAILHVGYMPPAGNDRTIVINSNGWLARVSRSKPLPSRMEQTNPIGALAAASWGCAEVFKTLVGLKNERGAPFESLEYSLFNYESSGQPGPELPKAVNADALLLGFGAIGNAVIALAHELPLTGTWNIVDYQKFGEENLGTCMLIGPDDVGKEKVSVSEHWSRPGWDIKGYPMRLETYLGRVDKDLPHPWIVLTAPDDSESRRLAQKLWPDIVINGAIGEFEVEVGAHTTDSNVACVCCTYKPAATFDWVAEVSKATGITPHRIAREGNSLVTEQDLQFAPAEHREWLAQRVGKPICSIAEEGLARKISTNENMKSDFRPSLPFVASLSAAFMGAELLKFLMGHCTILAPRIQHDILQGPHTALQFPQERRSDCECKLRAKNIAKYRNALKQRASPSSRQ